MLVTLGFVALVIGIILVVLGFTVAPRALHPGYGASILGVVLLLLGYLLPSLTHDGYHSRDDVGMAISLDT